ncbi:hypothetical protein [Nocardioides aurantiacus]|uniref:hypothetical protein n=1 Tax=Nocardioides aurantiacus TaxID=86796 RepID=UPI00403F30CA
MSWTFVAALVAAGAAILGAYWQRQTGKESTAAAARAATAAERAAAAAGKSADASDRSAAASESSVELNAATATEAGRRSDAESLYKRYQDAAAQLGHTGAAVRLAGVYSLARLADDWPEQRQVCIDVLCAYLRMKQRTVAETSYEGFEHEIQVPDDGDGQVRATIQAIIASRLAKDAAESWTDCRFNLTGAELVDFSLDGVRLSGLFLMNRALICGVCDFKSVVFAGGLDAQQLTIQGTLRLSGVTTEGERTIALTRSVIEMGGVLDVVLHDPPSAEAGWRLWLNGITCSGVFAIKVGPSKELQPILHLPGLTLDSHSQFQVAELPVSPNGNPGRPRFTATDWSTTATSRVDVPGRVRRKDGFVASGWTGVVLPDFADAYSGTNEVDAVVQADNE